MAMHTFSDSDDPPSTTFKSHDQYLSEGITDELHIEDQHEMARRQALEARTEFEFPDRDRHER